MKKIIVLLSLCTIIFSCYRFESDFYYVDEDIEKFVDNFSAEFESENVNAISDFISNTYLNNGLDKDSLICNISNFFAQCESIQKDAFYFASEGEEEADFYLSFSGVNVTKSNSTFELDDVINRIDKDWIIIGNGISGEDQINVFIQSFVNSFQNKNIIQLYHQNYLNDGLTQDSMNVYYNSIFTELPNDFSTNLDSSSIIIEQNGNSANIEFSIFYENDTLNIIDILRNENDEWILYGNQENPLVIPKTVLAELFTGTWCSSCPYAEAALSDLKTEFGSALNVLEYHILIGTDPWATEDTEDLMYWYGVEGNPNAMFNGTNNVASGDDNTINEYRAIIQNQLLEDYKIMLNCEHEIVDNTINIDVNLNITETYTGSDWQLKCRLYENNLRHNYVTYNYVVRLFTNPIDLSLESIGEQSHSISIEIDDAWVLSNCAYTIFVQNNDTKIILQSKNIELN